MAHLLLPTRPYCPTIFKPSTLLYASKSRPRHSKLVLTHTKRQHTTNTPISQKSSWTHPMSVKSAFLLMHILALYTRPLSDIYHPNRYTEAQILAVKVAHRKAHHWQDKVALGTVRLLRWGMDFVSGYRPQSTNGSLSKSTIMTEEKWITRFIFLESVAGVPGMVAGMLRHLKSIRKMRRDNGW